MFDEENTVQPVPEPVVTEPVVPEPVPETVVTEPVPEPVATEPVPETVPEPVAAGTVFQTTGDDKKGKKSSTKKIIICGIIVIAVIALIVAVFKVLTKKDPKTVVTEAFNSIYSEKTNKDPLEEIFGFKDLYNSMYTTPIENNFSLTLDKFSNRELAEYVDPYLGSGFSVNGTYDMSKMKYKYDFNIMYAGNDMTSADFYIDDTDILFALPDLTDVIFKLEYGKDLDKQMNSSPYLGKNLMESGLDSKKIKDYMDYVKKMSDPETRGFNLKALWERYKEGSEALNDFKEAMQVKEIGKAVYTVDGKEQKCRGYDVVFTKDATIEFIKTSSKFFMQDETLKNDMIDYMKQAILFSGSVYGSSESAEDMVNDLLKSADQGTDELIRTLKKYLNDINMTVYVTKDGRMAYMKGNTTVDYENETYDADLEMTFKGGYFLTQNYDAEINVSGESDFNMIITNEGTYDKKTLTADTNCEITADDFVSTSEWSSTYDVEKGDFDLILSTTSDNTDLFTLTVKGIVDELEKGKSFEFTMDSLDIEIPSLNTDIVLSGNYVVRPFKGSIDALEGETFDVLAATEDELQHIYDEIMTNLSSMMSQIQ